MFNVLLDKYRPNGIIIESVIQIFFKKGELNQVYILMKYVMNGQILYCLNDNLNCVKRDVNINN